MIAHTRKIRLGFFLVLSSAVLLGLLVMILGRSFWEKREAYLIRYQISVSGLEVGAPVKYNGVRVGRVESTAIDPEEINRTLVRLSLDAKTPVKENTRAILNVQGITGLKFIELVGGTSESVTLLPGSEIKAGTSVVDKLTGQAEAISLKVDLLASQLLDLTGDENRALIGHLLNAGGELVHTLNRTLESNGPQIHGLLTNLAQAADRLTWTLDEFRKTALEARELIGETRKVVVQLAEIHGVVEEARGMVADARRRLGDEQMGRSVTLLNALLERGATLLDRLDLVISRGKEDVLTSLHFLSESAENMRDFSRMIREDPSRLLRTPERRERALP